MLPIKLGRPLGRLSRLGSQVVFDAPPMEDQAAPRRRPEGTTLAAPRGPDFTAMLKQYCDLRRRVFSQTKLQLKQHQRSLPPADAARRRMHAHRRTKATASPNGCLRASTPEPRSPPSGGCTPSRNRKISGSNARDAASGNPRSASSPLCPDCAKKRSKRKR